MAGSKVLESGMWLIDACAHAALYTYGVDTTVHSTHKMAGATLSSGEHKSFALMVARLPRLPLQVCMQAAYVYKATC